MIDKIKKGLLLGIGIASLTGKEIEKRVRKLIKSGYFTEKEGKELIKKLAKEANKHVRNIRKHAEAEARKQLNKLNNNYGPEIKKLKKEIEILKRNIKNKAISETRKAAKQVLKKTRAKRQKKKKR